MTDKLAVKTLLQRNRNYATKHEPLPTAAEMKVMGLPVPKKQRILVVTCTDHRTVPEFLQMELQDAVLVMRNVGGHVAPILNGILVLDCFVEFSEIMIIHHTEDNQNCGATHFRDADIRAKLKRRVPENSEVDAMNFGAINDLEQSVRDDLAILKASPLIRKELAEHTFGFVYDLKTGLLNPVDG